MQDSLNQRRYAKVPCGVEMNIEGETRLQLLCIASPREKHRWFYDKTPLDEVETEGT